MFLFIKVDRCVIVVLYLVCVLIIWICCFVVDFLFVLFFFVCQGMCVGIFGLSFDLFD